MTNNQRSNCQQSLDHRESKKVPEKKFYSLPGGSDGKETACNVGELSSIPGLGRYPREGNNYPLQYSGLENSMDRGVWQATVHGVAKSQT